MKILRTAAIASLLASSAANASVNLFTDHQVVHMTEHAVYSDRFPTGEYPYIGRVGLEYECNNLTYSLALIHRSNVDITYGNEYYYNGIALGVKYSKCIFLCR